MGVIEAIKNFFGFLNGLMRNAEKADNKRHGALEVDHGNRKKNAEVRKGADRVWSRDSRSRLFRNNGNDKG